MEPRTDPNDCTPSTTWAWRRVKIAPAPQARDDRPSEARSFRSLLPWPQRKPLNVTVKYRGGAECWWEIRARGVLIRRPGSVALHDVLRDLYGGSIR